ncbi:hypothetical protein BDD12DRAFT_496101 [Trichophaea hybrida]|nr:hypothetical protein BDD12DRAFT_496101 [Trichophaea hybrida]
MKLLVHRSICKDTSNSRNLINKFHTDCSCQIPDGILLRMLIFSLSHLKPAAPTNDSRHRQPFPRSTMRVCIKLQLFTFLFAIHTCNLSFSITRKKLQLVATGCVRNTAGILVFQCWQIYDTDPVSLFRIIDRYFDARFPADTYSPLQGKIGLIRSPFSCSGPKAPESRFVEISVSNFSSLHTCTDFTFKSDRVFPCRAFRHDG